MADLVVQAFVDGHWQDALSIRFDDPGRHPLNSPCSCRYLAPFLAQYLTGPGPSLQHAVSANLPLSWDVVRLPHWPAFLFDIVPSGAARRFLLPRLPRASGLATQPAFELLSRCTRAPIGQLRIREAVAIGEEVAPIAFRRDQVIDLGPDFLDHAYAQGAPLGSATGAGGDAPKLLLTEFNQGEFYLDGMLGDDLAARHWLVKFPRNQGRAADQDVLRSEYRYYLALDSLGLETISADGLALEEGRQPSLWLPRFDRRPGAAGLERVAVESIYSLTDTLVPGSYLGHLDAIEALVRVWRASGQEAAIPGLLDEYLLRDLLNQVVGNTDNHGRNTAILRDREGVRLAPIYDLAPMVMDEQGVTRATKWPAPVEQAGTINWREVCQLLAVWDEPERLWVALRKNAERLRALPDLLQPVLPRSTWEHPRIPLRWLEGYLQNADLR